MDEESGTHREQNAIDVNNDIKRKKERRERDIFFFLYDNFIT